ncbi:MAG: hypothetical protein UW69_C0082G0003 [Microgenomates group bacterium GW2011_GWA2_44_7]|nr:MAG: hypothetical protein UW69_C0082G0003 [Microgenomates group bacterium GW2011_GWA2_44_7]KKT77859.1 MAG: hypothetical protein UW73_C0010G0004 [Microgenomates group bacterium GW2011_GWB1_44_8]
MAPNFRAANLDKDGSLLNDLDNKIFTRDFDIPSMSVQEEVEYLKDCQTFIYFEDNNPVGFYCYSQDNDGLVILKGVGVIPGHQNKGVGRKLMDNFLSRIEGKKSSLVVHPKNSGAIILYLKCGYKINGWKENYYGDDQPRLLLERPGTLKPVRTPRSERPRQLSNSQSETPHRKILKTTNPHHKTVGLSGTGVK